MRAELPIGGWKIKKVDDKFCKVTFAAAPDFKIPLFLAKQVTPKSGNIALTFKNYA